MKGPGGSKGRGEYQKKQEKREKKKGPMGVVEGCLGYWCGDSSCHGYCDQCSFIVITQTMFSPLHPGGFITSFNWGK